MSRDVRVRARTAGGRASGGHDRWLVSYADFITLLFAFFTVMYAVSTVDAGKIVPAASSIQHAFSMPASSPVVVTVPELANVTKSVVPRAPIVPPAAGGLDSVRRRLAAELSDAVTSGRLEIADDARGLLLSLPVEATFATGSADVHPDARRLIGRIAATLRPLENAIRIEGHTDDVPIRTARYGSNWELSTARASAVVAFLIGSARLEPVRLSAAGYGEFHPRAPNDTATNRARNRRVDIVVLDPAVSREEPSRGGARHD
ncbi:MAG: flagellar motor protein MotB [Vicinamibacterales bacterium]